MIEIFVNKGMTTADATDIMCKFANYPDLFVDFMMHEKLELMVPGEDDNPWKDGLVMLMSFIVFGFVPLSVYAFLYSASNLGVQELFILSCMLTACTLFALGAFKARVTCQAWWKGGLEILIMGSCTAATAFIIGYVVELIVSS